MNRITAALMLSALWAFAPVAGGSSFADEDCIPPSIPQPAFRDKTYEVKDFGALGDGKANDTPAINRAIDKCNAEGGGTLHFVPGNSWPPRFISRATSACLWMLTVTG